MYIAHILLYTVCALLLRLDIPPEQSSTAMYWIEKAKGFYPTDPTVFSLQVSSLNHVKVFCYPGIDRVAVFCKLYSRFYI